MTYTSVAAVKTTLGITGSNQDTILTQLVADADITINSLLNIDGFDSATKTEKIQRRQIKLGSYGYKIYFDNFNVKSITEVEWQSYTGTLDDDYRIVNRRSVEIKDLYNYTPGSSAYFETVTVTYTYGWDRSPSDELPSDIELMARLLVVGQYQELYPLGYNASENGTVTGGYSQIKEYKLGEEQIKRGGGTTSWATGSITAFRSPEERKTFNQLLQKYKKVDVLY